jgi:hypothetical protein
MNSHQNSHSTKIKTAANYNPSVNSRMLRLGVHMLSTEYRGAWRNDWSLRGIQFGEKFGEIMVRNNSAIGR